MTNRTNISYMLGDENEVFFYERLLRHYLKQALIAEDLFDAYQRINRLMQVVMSSRAAALLLQMEMHNKFVDDHPLADQLHHQLKSFAEHAPIAYRALVYAGAVLPAGHIGLKLIMEQVLKGLFNSVVDDALALEDEVLQYLGTIFPCAACQCQSNGKTRDVDNFTLHVSNVLRAGTEGAACAVPGVIRWFPTVACLENVSTESGSVALVEEYSDLCQQFHDKVMAQLISLLGEDK